MCRYSKLATSTSSGVSSEHQRPSLARITLLLQKLSELRKRLVPTIESRYLEKNLRDKRFHRHPRSRLSRTGQS